MFLKVRKVSVTTPKKTIRIMRVAKGARILVLGFHHISKALAKVRFLSCAISGNLQDLEF
jgi:hypothetical protein